MTPETKHTEQEEKSLFQTMLEVMERDTPEEEWQKLPTGGAENHDHCLYQYSGSFFRFAERELRSTGAIESNSGQTPSGI